jgi:hypothetical protein
MHARKEISVLPSPGYRSYKYVSKKSLTFREEMNCEMFTNTCSTMESVPMGRWEFKPVGDQYLRSQPARRKGATLRAEGIEYGRLIRSIKSFRDERISINRLVPLKFPHFLIFQIVFLELILLIFLILIFTIENIYYRNQDNAEANPLWMGIRNSERMWKWIFKHFCLVYTRDLSVSGGNTEDGKGE